MPGAGTIIIIILLLFIYYAEAAKQHQNKKADIANNTLKRKQYTEIKTIKSIKHLHIIAAKMFPKIFFDQIFRRRNKMELTADCIFLKCANDTVLTTISKCMKSQIVTIEHFQPEDDSITLINK